MKQAYPTLTSFVEFLMSVHHVELWLGLLRTRHSSHGRCMLVHLDLSRAAIGYKDSSASGYFFQNVLGCILMAAVARPGLWIFSRFAYISPFGQMSNFKLKRKPVSPEYIGAHAVFFTGLWRGLSKSHTSVHKLQVSRIVSDLDLCGDLKHFLLPDEKALPNFQATATTLVLPFFVRHKKAMNQQLSCT